MNALFDYTKVSLTDEPTILLIPSSMEDYPELQKVLDSFNEVSSDYIPPDEIQDYSTAELIIPAIDCFLTDKHPDAHNQLAEMGGIIITQVIQLSGVASCVLVSVTVFDGSEEQEEQEEQESDWE
jgi:mRNA degradation ribonuclease J1/J2